MQSSDHKRLLEAALFMSPEPMTVEHLSKTAGVSSLGYLKGTLLELRDEYAGRGFHLVETPEGWMFQVDNRFLDRVADLTPYSDLPEGQKRTLALVAYKEPITQSEVIRIQGNKTYAYIRSLSAKGLLRAEKHGRTKMLSLTQEFERYFGDEKGKIREHLIAKLGKRGTEIPPTDAPAEKLNMSRD
jgi:segregation and condensation protein B